MLFVHNSSAINFGTYNLITQKYCILVCRQTWCSHRNEQRRLLLSCRFPRSHCKPANVSSDIFTVQLSLILTWSMISSSWSSYHWQFSSWTWYSSVKYVERRTAPPSTLDSGNITSQPRQTPPFQPSFIWVREVRRASNSAAVNLGLQQHHQSTSSNSTVPTVMLITVSLIYVLLMTPGVIVLISLDVVPYSVWCDKSWTRTLHVAAQFIWGAFGLYHVVFAYNFFVYVVTWKQFRYELRQLCSCVSSSSSSTAADAADWTLQL